MERTRAMPKLWFLCRALVCLCLNYAIDPTLAGLKSPLMMVTGFFYDISPLLSFRFNEPVYFLQHKQQFPSDSKEIRGRWMGVAEDVGNSLTYEIYNESTGTIVQRSEVRLALDGKLRNIREDPILFDSTPDSDVQYVNGEHGPTSVVPNNGEPPTLPPRHGRNGKSDLDARARQLAEKARKDYVRNETVVDSIAEHS